MLELKLISATGHKKIKEGINGINKTIEFDTLMKEMRETGQ
jgi:hypothetical protein